MQRKSKRGVDFFQTAFLGFFFGFFFFLHFFKGFLLFAFTAFKL